MVTQSVLLVLLLAAVASACYAAILNHIQHTYTPDWVWVTVVVGNAMIGLVQAVFCAMRVLPWEAFLLLLYTNIAMGLPIIVWQISQARARVIVTRHQQRQRHEEPHDAEATARRPTAD